NLERSPVLPASTARALSAYGYPLYRRHRLGGDRNVLAGPHASEPVSLHGTALVAYATPETGELEPPSSALPGCARGRAGAAHHLPAPLDFGCRVAERRDGGHQSGRGLS